MNKTEMIDVVAKDAGISKAAAGSAIDAVVGAVSGALAGGDSVTLVGFGTFSVAVRAARKGRNPRTGQEIQIKASKTPKFKAGKTLRDAVG